MKQKFTLKKIPVKKLTEFSCGVMLSVLTMMFPLIAKGQIPASSYTFTQTSGTYTPITGGTQVNATFPDQWTSDSIPLATPFLFCGVSYTRAWMTSNGVLALGGTAGPVNYLYNGISGDGGVGGSSNVHLCPFGADLYGSTQTGAVGELRYQYVGNEHVFQWKDGSRYLAGDRFSFQARLNTVTGVITYVYSVTTVGTSTSYFPAVGIRTASTAGNWQSRLVASNATSSWAASTAATATTDLCRFTTSATNPKQPATGQTYIFTPPPACNTSTSLPTAGTITAAPTGICLTGNVALTFAPTTPMPAVTGITYKWQTSPTVAGVYTDIPGAVTTLPAYTTTTPITASAYFKCVVLCNTTTTVLTSAASNQVVVNNPGTPTGTPGSRCGPGSVALAASGPAGTTLRWYENATGGAPLATGTNLTTPYITTTRNFYVTAGTAPAPANATVGAGALTSSFQYLTIFAGGWGGYKHQYLIREAEMIAAGVMPGDAISSISVDNANGTGTYNGFAMSLKSTTSTVLTSAFETGATSVFGPINYTTTVGINTFTFGAPYTYTGGSLLIETCWGNPTYSNPYSNLKYDNTTYAATHYAYDDNQLPSVICAGPVNNGTPENVRPQFKFNFNTSCQGNRVPVLATITTPPAVTKTAPDIVCSNAITQVSVASSPMSNYTTYAWTPNTADLYTNAGATTPYTTGSMPTVYFKSDVAGMHTYYMFASGATPAACTYADTVRIWVQPDSVTIAAFPDTLCAPSGSTTLKLVPATGYAANGIQWQQSADGITYTNITGATGVTYVTPMIATNTYYKALIKSSNAAVNCEAPVKLIVVANPTLLTWTDSFNCGPGTVTLKATAGGYGNVRWYSTPTASIPVGSGSTWTTPYLGATTNYYVESGTGSIQPPPTFIGTGTNNTWWGYLPYFSTYYTANKAQWLITANEMTAAGFSPGLITSIAFDVTTKSGTTTIANLTYRMKNISGSALGTVFHTGLQDVFTTTNYNPTANAINNHTLQNPFYWDGVSSIVLEECSTNPTNQYGYVNVKYNSGSCIYYYTSSTTSTATNCAAPAFTYSTATRPNIRFTMLGGCRSGREEVTAFIHPVPNVDLGNDINECVDAGAIKVLDAGVQPNTPQFLWDNGSISQVRAVSASGTYSVKVTNQYTCVKSDTINVILRKNPVVELGNDTSVCNGVVLPLNAGTEGISYFWNTGETTQIIDISSPGTYNVFVTNSQGCTKVDTITVDMAGQLPGIAGIQVTNNGINTFTFTAVNPQNVIGYDWDFGDGSAHSYQAAPSHVYANSGNYVVVLKLSSSCGFRDDSTSAHIVGINQLNVNNSEMMVYPNPSRATATILNKGTLKMEKIELYNVLGQVIYTAKADSKDKHTLNLGGIASGIYTIQVYTDKGTVARKLEIIK